MMEVSTFKDIIKRMIDRGETSVSEIAKTAKVNEARVERWVSGPGAPINNYRFHIVNVLERAAQEKRKKKNVRHKS